MESNNSSTQCTNCTDEKTETNEELSQDNSKTNEYMKVAIEVAKSALHVGEVPVGCVIVLNQPYHLPSNDSNNSDIIIPKGIILSYGCNQVNATRDATRHAEMVRECS